MSLTKTCLRCGATIPEVATYCNQCGGYQNWRRHLNFSSTFLALVVAVISVATAFFNVAAERIWPPKSEIEVSFYEHSQDGLSMLAINRGERSGYITGVNLTTPKMGSNIGIPAGINLALAKQAVEVQPGLNRFNIEIEYPSDPATAIGYLTGTFDLPEASVRRAIKRQEAFYLSVELSEDGSVSTTPEGLRGRTFAVEVDILNSDGKRELEAERFDGEDYNRGPRVLLPNFAFTEGFEHLMAQCNAKQPSPLDHCDWSQIDADFILE